jgi:hypothetical protein
VATQPGSSPWRALPGGSSARALQSGGRSAAVPQRLPRTPVRGLRTAISASGPCGCARRSEHPVSAEPSGKTSCSASASTRSSGCAARSREWACDPPGANAPCNCPWQCTRGARPFSCGASCTACARFGERRPGGRSAQFQRPRSRQPPNASTRRPACAADALDPGTRAKGARGASRRSGKSAWRKVMAERFPTSNSSGELC